MHAAPNVPALYFSESKNAFQAFAGAILCIAMAIDPAASPRRRIWLEFMNQGNGWVGTIMFLLPALLFGWWTARAIWRSDSSAPAAHIAGDALVVHRSFLVAKPIPIAALQPVTIASETARTQVLRLRWSDSGGRSRSLNIRSNIIRDGQLSLEFFAVALNAARDAAQFTSRG